MSFEWEGIDELDQALASIASGAETVLESGLLSEAGTLGERMMKAAAPVDTGQLQNRTQVTRVAPADVEWRSDVPYAGYQDFGTARQPGRPYFRSSIVAVGRLITRRSPTLLQRSLARVLRSGGVWNPRKLI